MAATEGDPRPVSPAATWRTPLVIVVCGSLIGMLTFGPRSTFGFFMQPISHEFGWGRDVFALPGSIHSALAKGCHALIRDGAILARSAQDVLDDLGLSAPPGAQASLLEPARAHDALQQRLLERLREGEATLDDLFQAADEPAPRVIAALSFLELAGAIDARAGQRYALR